MLGPSSLPSHYSLLSFLLLPSHSLHSKRAPWVDFYNQKVEFPIPAHTLAPAASVISLLSVPCTFSTGYHLGALAPAVPSGWPALPPDSPHLSSHLPLLPLGILHTCPFYILCCSYLGLSCSCICPPDCCPLPSPLEHEQAPRQIGPPDPSAQITWHIVGASYIFVEWMNKRVPHLPTHCPIQPLQHKKTLRLGQPSGSVC